jgi:type II secretory pathway component HofQ
VLRAPLVLKSAVLGIVWGFVYPSNHRKHSRPLSQTTSHTHNAYNNNNNTEQRKTTPLLAFNMTTFEPSLSTTMRASSHDAPSMADQLPSINFGFDDLRSRMNQFTARFDAFIETGRRRVLEERNQFRMNIAELHGTHAYINIEGTVY